MNAIGVLSYVLVALTVQAPQVPPPPLDSLVRWAMEANPRITAAEERWRAAEAGIAPAGSLPDPVLSLGLRNVPVSDPGFGDMMAMKVVGLSQRLPYAGKRSLARDAARFRAAARTAAFQDLRLGVARDVRQAYYELAYIARALEVVARHTDVLDGLVEATDGRYAVGTAGQEDVFQALAERTALSDEAARLEEHRRGVLAGLNRLLGRPPDVAVDGAAVPERLRSAAVYPPSRVSFTSLRPGARVADSPLRPLTELLARAEANNPGIQVGLARVDAQRSRLELARKAHLPDLDVSLSYGQRNGRSDMLSLNVAVPLPVHRGARQTAWARQAEAELAALEADQADRVNGILERTSAIYADLEGDRTRLALLTTGMLPQGEAALQAAMAGFQVGRTDFLTVLTDQATLFQYETSFHRTLTDFAGKLAELERLVGEEILR